MRVGAHAPLAARGERSEVGAQGAGLVEELVGAVGAHPSLERGEVLWPLGEPGERDLVGADGPLDGHAVDLLWAGPALRRAQHDHRPARPRGVSLLAGATLQGADLADDLVERRRHPLVHPLGLGPANEAWCVAVALEERA